MTAQDAYCIRCHQITTHVVERPHGKDKDQARCTRCNHTREMNVKVEKK